MNRTQVILLIGLAVMGISHIAAAQIDVLSDRALHVQQYYNGTLKTTTSGSSVTLLEIQQSNLSVNGSITVTFDYQGTGDWTGEVDIRKNGVQIGNTHSISPPAGTIIENVNTSTNITDTLEIWGRKINGLNIGVSNFSIYYIWNVPEPTSLQASTGNFYVDYTWQPGPGSVSTDTFNISVNGTWTNGTVINTIHTLSAPHGWANITVQDHNKTNPGYISGVTSMNTQVPNNPVTAVPVISSPANASHQSNNFLNLTWNETTDPENDTMSYWYQVYTNSNYASPISVSASSTTGGYVASNSIDGILTTEWFSSYVSTEEYLEFDLGTNKIVKGSQVYWEAYGLNYALTNIRFEVKPDGGAFTQVLTSPLIYPNYHDKWNTYTWSPVSARYIRVYLAGSGPSYKYMAEFKAITNSYDLANSDELYNQSNTTSLFSGPISTIDGQLYFARVKACDGYGSCSNWSNDIQFTEVPMSNPAISESQIYAWSQANIITISASDADGSVSSVLVGISYNGSETNYTMTQSGTSWTYSFKTGIPGTYTVSGFYATDISTGNTSIHPDFIFVVVPVPPGGSGNPPSNNVPPAPISYTPAPSPTTTTVVNVTPYTPINVTYHRQQINLKTLAGDTTGRLILQILVLAGVAMLAVGLKKNSKSSVFLTGLFLVLGSGYALNYF